MGTDSIYLFDVHSKDENDNLSSSGKVFILKFDTLHSLKIIQDSFLQCLPDDFILSIAIYKKLNALLMPRVS